MRKLHLDTDALRVESFETEAGGQGRGGTVHGQSFVPPTEAFACTNYGTCQGTCVQTCGGPTCEPPCRYFPTMYLTCREGCSWTNGDAVCMEPVDIE